MKQQRQHSCSQGKARTQSPAPTGINWGQSAPPNPKQPFRKGNGAGGVNPTCQSLSFEQQKVKAQGEKLLNSYSLHRCKVNSWQQQRSNSRDVEPHQLSFVPVETRSSFRGITRVMPGKTRPEPALPAQPGHTQSLSFHSCSFTGICCLAQAPGTTKSALK